MHRQHPVVPGAARTGGRTRLREPQPRTRHGPSDETPPVPRIRPSEVTGAMEAAMAISEPPLAGQWMHSFEEDHGDVVVYRPATHDFPRARGRDGLGFGPAGPFPGGAGGGGAARGR